MSHPATFIPRDATITMTSGEFASAIHDAIQRERRDIETFLRTLGVWEVRDSDGVVAPDSEGRLERRLRRLAFAVKQRDYLLGWHGGTSWDEILKHDPDAPHIDDGGEP